MKAKKYIIVFCSLMLIILVSTLIYSYSTGITGVTRKTGGSGCSCHGSASTSVTVSINGPDSVSPGETSVYTVSITGGPLVRGGVDIAAQNGVLNIIAGQGLKKIGAELTHEAPKLPSSGSVSFQFNYTAPSTLGKDTIYATGNSVNFNGNTSGDQWNHANNRIIVIRNPVGIINQTTSESFQLYQNYPNPFNPATIIRFSIPINKGSQGDISLIIYDVLGNKIQTLVNGSIAPGIYELKFGGTNLPSGIYYYTLKASDYTETKKMVLIK